MKITEIRGIVCFNGDERKAKYRTSVLCNEINSNYGRFSVTTQKRDTVYHSQYYFEDFFIELITYDSGLRCMINSLEPYETA